MKTGEKGEKGVHRGGTDVEHYQMNVVCQRDPLSLKIVVTAAMGLFDMEIQQVLWILPSLQH